jgi:hypothetical protein
MYMNIYIYRERERERGRSGWVGIPVINQSATQDLDAEGIPEMLQQITGPCDLWWSERRRMYGP